MKFPDTLRLTAHRDSMRLVLPGRPVRASFLSLLASALLLAGPLVNPSNANAVAVNPDGVGQVLLYPYYTTNNGQNTLLSVVNTSDIGKVVRVKFLEGYNGRDVFNANVWLAPHDVWSTAVFSLSQISGTPISNPGAGALVNDSSCSTVVPPDAGPGTSAFGDGWVTPFSASAYEQNGGDGYPQTLARTQEGSIQVITMADITAGSATAVAITPTGAGTRNCAAVGGDQTSNHDLVAPGEGTGAGGLAGAAAIINVEQGTIFSYAATAIGDFTATSLYTNAASPPLDPSLPDLRSANGSPLFAIAQDGDHMAGGIYASGSNGSLSQSGSGHGGADAVNGALSAAAFISDYLIDPGLGANTDWVVTMPTRQFYTDPLYTGTPGIASAPFAGFAANGGICQNGVVVAYDRTGMPVGGVRSLEILCTHTFVLDFSGGAGQSGGYADPLGTSLGLTANSSGMAGWASLDLTGSNPSFPAAAPYFSAPTTEGYTWSGLPAVGITTTNLVNANVQPGVSSNYSYDTALKRTSACRQVSAGACPAVHGIPTGSGTGGGSGPGPIVTITTSPSNAAPGTPVTVSWNASNAGTCYTQGTSAGVFTGFSFTPSANAWPAAPSVNICQVSGGGNGYCGNTFIAVPNGSASGAQTFGLTCYTLGSNLAGSAQSVVTVSAGTGSGSASLSINPDTIGVPGQATLTWSAAGMAACDAKASDPGVFTDFTYTPANGWPPNSDLCTGSACNGSTNTVTVSPTASANGVYHFVLTCATAFSPSSTITRTAALTVNGNTPAPGAPTVTLDLGNVQIAAGGSTTITWSAAGADTCVTQDPQVFTSNAWTFAPASGWSNGGNLCNPAGGSCSGSVSATAGTGASGPWLFGLSCSSGTGQATNAGKVITVGN